MNDNFYKVLWIDDDTLIVRSTQMIAEDYNLNLVHFTNWKDASVELERNFEEYSAIILDANCKIDAEQLEDEIFISAVLPQMQAIFGRKQKDIPWYILSAGTMGHFDFVVRGALNARKDRGEEWGEMLYMKDAIDEERKKTKLFENIKRVASEMGHNIVLHRYGGVFQYMGGGKLINSKARKYMLKMLEALYYPEENIGFQYEANPIRKVLEYVFRAARDIGLCAEECFEANGGIHLNDASRYMAGRNTVKSNGVRYGEAGDGNEGSRGEKIFDPMTAQTVWNLLTFCNCGSHTEEVPADEPYIIDADNKELFFGYVLQLCHVIKWFGDYAGKHPDVEANKRMKRYVKPEGKGDKGSKDTPKVSKDDVIGKEYTVYSGDGFYWAGNCKLSQECRSLVKFNAKIIIEDVVGNTLQDKKRYPFIATKIKVVKDGDTI